MSCLGWVFPPSPHFFYHHSLSNYLLFQFPLFVRYNLRHFFSAHSIFGPFFRHIFIMVEDQSSPQIPANCEMIERVLRNSPATWLMYFQLLLLSSLVISIFVLLYQFHKQRIDIHRNLMILLANILALHVFYHLAWLCSLLRYRILMFVYHDPCQLLTPFWTVSLMIGPYYLNSVAFPAFHLTLSFERFRATFYAQKYEVEGQRLIVGIAAIIWLLSACYMTFIIWSASFDPAVFAQPMGIIYLTSEYNSKVIFGVSLITLVVVIFTTFCDWRIYKLNRLIRAKRTSLAEYSLSTSYQLNENALTMRLILPLDLCYSLLYPLYILAVLIIRAYQPVMPLTDYFFCYHGANTLLYVYTLASVMVYIQFVKFMSKNRRRNVSKLYNMGELTRMHFKQLKTQWG